MDVSETRLTFAREVASELEIDMAATFDIADNKLNIHKDGIGLHIYILR